MTYRTAQALTAVFAATMCVACADHDDDLTPASPKPQQAWVVRVAGHGSDSAVPALSWRAAYESLTVSLSGRSEQTRAIVVTASEPWLTLSRDTLPADSIIAFTTATNQSGQRRSATLTLTDAHDPSLTAQLQVEQLSQSDQSANGDPRDQLYLGYGYDVYKALESPMAVRAKAPILDYDRLPDAGGKGLYQMIQDCHLSRLTTRYVSATDIHVFGRDLTEQQTGDADHRFEGCNQECMALERLLEPGHGTMEQQNFGHGTIEKTVASRIIDRASLMDLQRRDVVPFSEAFADRLRRIRYVLTGEERRQAVIQTLVDFGTHVIVQVDLGGRIDYNFSMQKSSSFNTVEEMRKEVEYTMGRLADTDRSTMARATSSSKSKVGAITVSGGSEATRRQIEADVQRLTTSSQLDPVHLAEWLASISYSDQFERDPSLAITHFELMPLWDVVTADVRSDFLEATFALSQRSDCQLPSQFTGTDIYEVSTADDALFRFDDAAASADRSLCHLLYIDGEPVVEVCSEYVPKIRTDERVVIVYPIYQHKIRLNRGLFIGDGIHQPAFVGFSGADCYVNPIDSMPPGRRLDRLFYVNGTLFPYNPTSLTNLTGGTRTVQDDCYYYVGSDIQRTPIVKLGSKFWTRHDISYEMGFTLDPESAEASSDDYLIDDVLYTRFYHDLGYYAGKDNAWTWGWQPNTFYGTQANTKWYLPTAYDARELLAFIGFNPKALYRGQVSGWEAQFSGYYGTNDLIHGGSFGDGQNALRYRGERNFIATRTNEEGNANAVVLVLDKDYHFRLYATEGLWHDDYFPVRPMRGFMFTYPTLKEINDNTQ